MVLIHWISIAMSSKARYTLMVICSVVLTASFASAQRYNMLSRSLLDSLVNPALSQKAHGILRAESEHLDIGTIGQQAPATIAFEVHNISNERVTIAALRSSCSCLKINTTPQHLDKGASLTIEAEFNPARRSGAFSYDILVYTSKDYELPTLRLNVKGEVKESDEWSHLPERMGSLCLSRRSVLLDGVTPGIRRSERIACANGGDKPIRLYATSTIEGLTLHCEPEVIEPGCKGDIVVSYEPQGEPSVPSLSVALLVEGVDASPSQRMIRVMIQR